MKTRMTLLAGLLLAGFAVLQAAEEIKGNGHIVTRTIEISDYDEILLAGTVDFYYVQSNKSPGLELTIDENLLPFVKIEVKGRQLVVGYKKGVNLNPTKSVIRSHSKWLKKVKLTRTGTFCTDVPIEGNELELKTSGSGQIHIKRPIKVYELALIASGSGGIVADIVQTDNLKCKVLNAGNILIGGGQATNATFTINGSGDINSFNCKLQNLFGKIAGSGNMNVCVTKTLKASVLGSGNIRYKGTAAVTSRKLGSGSVEQAQ